MSTTKTHVITLFFLAEDGPVYIDDPSLATVLDALGSLDGHDTDTLSVTLSNGDSMDVGGGADDHYKCHARTKNSFYHLVDPMIPKDMNETVEIHMDDEISTFPRCSIVSLEIVKIAVECFCVNGELSSKLQWDNTLKYDPI